MGHPRNEGKIYKNPLDLMNAAGFPLDFPLKTNPVIPKDLAPEDTQLWKCPIKAQWCATLLDDILLLSLLFEGTAESNFCSKHMHMPMSQLVLCYPFVWLT